MTSRLHTQNQRTKKETHDLSTTSVQGMFQPRSFVVQAQKGEHSQQQPNLMTSYKQTEQYGHNFNQIQLRSTDVSVEPVQMAAIKTPIQLKASKTSSAKYENQNNLKKIPKGNVTVFRVEPKNFNEKYSHVNTKNNGQGYIYNPKPEPKQFENIGKGKKTPAKDTNTKKYAKKFLKGRENQPAGNRTFMNIGRPQRALDFYKQKSNNPNEKANEFVIKSFKIPSEVAKTIQKDSVHERLAKQHPNKPINVDRITANQFGLPQRYTELLNQTMIPGSTKIENPKKLAEEQKKKRNPKKGNPSDRSNNTQKNKKVKGKKPYGKKK